MRKIISSGVCLAALSGFSATADTESPLAPMYACAEITEDTARLACYDEAVGKTREEESTGKFAVISRDDAEKIERDTFGFAMPSLPSFGFLTSTDQESDKTDTKRDEDGKIEEIIVDVARVEEDPYGKLIVYLENGQEWRQIDSKSIFIGRSYKPSKATIKRAAFGSFFLTLENRKSVRAKRVN